MLQPYSKLFTFTTTDNNQVVKLPYPARCVVHRINIYRVGTGAISMTFYTRAFTGPAQSFYSAVAGPDSKVLYQSSDYLKVRVGDVVNVVCASVGGYAGAQTVLWVGENGKSIVTDKAFSSVAGGGTIALAIPPAAQPLYQVTAAITGTTNASSTTEFLYTNQDVLPTGDIISDQAIYVVVANPATYQVNIVSGVVLH